MAVRAIAASSHDGPDATGKAHRAGKPVSETRSSLKTLEPEELAGSWQRGGGSRDQRAPWTGVAPARGGCRGRSGEDATGPSPLATPTRPLCLGQLTGQGTQGMSLIRPGWHWGGSSG